MNRRGALLAGLRVHAERMAENHDGADIFGEQRTVAEPLSRAPAPTISAPSTSWVRSPKSQ
ncbi:MAG: hypothetical protein PHQ28_07290 [Mycobacterium sp.]|nr:hypothetical protein [Mycobacterium sp.]